MTVKSRLLEILEKEKGETLSGEKLAEELHCTRAAIWKAVKSLREEGYMIEAGPNKGYMLVKANDRLSVEAIRPFCRFRRFISKFIRKWILRTVQRKRLLLTEKPVMEALCWRDARQKDVAGGDAVLFTAGCRNLPECDPRTERQSSGESASDCRGGSGSLQSSKENYRS